MTSVNEMSAIISVDFRTDSGRALLVDAHTGHQLVSMVPGGNGSRFASFVGISVGSSA